jgi:hypothetical protein
LHCFYGGFNDIPVRECSSHTMLRNEFAELALANSSAG